MWPTSDSFLRAVRASHQMVARATVCATFQTGASPTGTRIPILAGDVSLDGTADVRGSLDMTTDGRSMWPDRASSLLAPYGNEIYVERGLKYSDDLVEYVPCGYYRIDSPEQDEVPDGPIRITGQDRMAGLVDAKLLAPVQFGATDTLGFIVDTLVSEVYPDAVIVWDDATDLDVLARSVIVEEDRFAFLDDLVRAQGKIWYWDRIGQLQIRSAPDPGSPVWEINAGAGGVLIAMSRVLTRAGVVNAVVAAGEGADTISPVRAVAIDNNALSPTYFHGRFGPVPAFYRSNLLFTPEQCQAAAAAELRKHLGLPYSIDFATVPNPALEPWDPLRTRASTRTGRETHVLESVTIPLVPEAAMTGTTREQSVVLIGSVS